MATEDEIARVILLRLLWLQQRVRRAAILRQDDAAIDLARSCVEGAIAGLYCVNVPGVARRFDARAGKDAKKLVAGFQGPGSDLLGDVLDHLGEGRLPLPGGMVEAIITNGGSGLAQDLYKRFYAPLSSMYAHAGPLALMRHVHPKSNKTRARPYATWNRRAAVNVSDAMVGLVAGAIAGPGHSDSALFQRYADTHLARAWTPLAFVVRGLALTRLNWRHAPKLITLTRRLAAAGGDYKDEDVDELIQALTELVGFDPDDETSVAAVAELREHFLRAMGSQGEAPDDK